VFLKAQMKVFLIICSLVLLFKASECRNLPFLLPPVSGEVQKATKEVQEVADEVILYVEMRLKDVMKLYNAIVYTSTFNERSNGTDYRIVMQISDDLFTIIEVFKAEYGKVLFFGLVGQLGSTLNELIGPFGETDPVTDRFGPCFSLFSSTSGCRNLPFLLPPGFSKVQKATKKVQEVADEVKYIVELRFDYLMRLYKAIVYTSANLPTGTNYIIVVQLNDYLFTVIGAFKPLNGGRAEFRGFVGPFDSHLFGQFGSFGGTGTERLFRHYNHKFLKFIQGK